MKSFTGNLFGKLWMIHRLSSVLGVEDLRNLLMTFRQMGPRIRKSVVLVEVSGSVWMYSPMGGGGGLCIF